MLALLNERWRTRVDGTTDAAGAIALHATYGEYVAHLYEGLEGERLFM